MRCDNCNTFFARPLELYNGDWACPNCRRSMSLSSVQLTLTGENDELYKLSEICYMRALTSQGNKKAYAGFLNKAMNYCKEAAYSGHPKALVRLGFLYDNGYFSLDETEAFKQAYECYAAVWCGKILDKRNITADAEYSDGGKKVKMSAAKRCLELLKDAPAKMRVQARYRYENVAARLKEEGLYDGDAPDAAYRVAESDRSSRILEILGTCFSKEKAPLFGLLFASGEDLRQACEVKEKRKNSEKSKFIFIAEKVALTIIDIDDGKVRALKTESDFKSVPDGKYCLYFFNTNGKHCFSGAKLSSIKRTLESGDSFGDFVKVKELIPYAFSQSEYTDYIFSDDDILMYKSRAESVSHALCDLIRSVQERIKRGEL